MTIRKNLGERIKIMKYVLFLVMFLFSSQAVALNCEKQPSCEELNYSKEDDPACKDDGYILCPFDFSYKKCTEFDCEKLGFTQSDKSAWCGKISKCQTDESYTACKALCEVGDVYYSDGTCGYADDYDGTKIPVGVVYWVTDNGRHGKVINLHKLGREARDKPFDPTNPYDTRFGTLYWGYDNYDVEELPNYDKTNIVEKLKAYDPDLYDGQGNTDKILADSGPAKCSKYDSDYYEYCIPQAAQAARDFYPPTVEPDNPKVGKGKWYFPALGELMDLYGYDNSQITDYYSLTTGASSGAKGDNIEIINNTIYALMKKEVVAESFRNEWYSSSSENGMSSSWQIFMSSGNRMSKAKYNSGKVRVSLQF